MKTTSSATTSHATPVKANTGKSVVKNKILRIGEEPPVTALKQSSPASVSTATTASLISSNQESSLVSVLTALTATTASLISSSQLTTTISSKQSNSSNLARALDFGYLPVHANKERTSLTFAILLMSRANAWNTCLMQEISLSVKKANWRSFLTTPSLKIFKWLSLNWLQLLEVQLLQHFFQCPQRKQS